MNIANVSLCPIIFVLVQLLYNISSKRIIFKRKINVFRRSSISNTFLFNIFIPASFQLVEAPLYFF